MELAKVWYLKAAEVGQHPDASCRLGHLHRCGPCLVGYHVRLGYLRCSPPPHGLEPATAAAHVAPPVEHPEYPWILSVPVSPSLTVPRRWRAAPPRPAPPPPARVRCKWAMSRACHVRPLSAVDVAHKGLRGRSHGDVRGAFQWYTKGAKRGSAEAQCVRPVPVQMWAGVSPVPAQMWRG